jgi:dipeptidyl aminopeptidase/acylaminoacyl peptidase
VSVTAGQQSTVPAGGAPTVAVTMTLDEQMRWGNAAGAGLDVVFPAVQSIAMFTHTGSVYGSLSPDGRFFLGSYYLHKGEQDYESGHFTYDVAAGKVVSDVTPAQASCPEYSPNGQWIAYSSAGEQGSQMCFIPATGGPSTCVGTAQVVSGCPYWSPDSQWVAFYRYDWAAGETYFNLYKVHPDGSELTPLTSGQENAKVAPDWSPDGAQIAYIVRLTPPESSALPLGELWVMDADGGNARRLQENLYGYTHPYWNPDGQTLLVRGYEDGESRGMWLAPTAGGPPERIPGTEVGGFDGLWSPTPKGWPLLLPTYTGNTNLRTLYYYNGDGQPLQVFATPSWGPIWSADRQTAAFGDGSGTQADEVTTVYFMRLVPGFYP